MSKAKTVSKKAPIAKTPSNVARKASTPVASTRTLPLGFASMFGFLAYLSLCGLAVISPYFFSGFWPSSYEYWPQGVFLALTACTCVLLALNPKPKIQNSKFKTAIFIALFFAWCVFSLWRAAYLHDAILEISRVAGVVAWFFIVRELLKEKEFFARRALWFLMCVAGGGVLVCAPAVWDYFLTRNPRQFATFYNPNLFANYCALVLPLCGAGALALWREAKRDKLPIEPNAALALGTIIFFIIASGLVVTSSKGGFLAVTCGMLIFLLAVFRARGERAKKVLRAHRALVAVAVLLVLIGGAGIFSKMILPRLSSRIENDHSTMFRVYTWKGTLKMASAKPISGHGPGSFPSVYTQFAETGYTRTAHQLWLQIAAEHGVPALLFLLFACGASTLVGLRALQTDNWIYAAGGLGALAAFFVHGLTDSGWSIISIATLAMGVLALLGAGGPRLEAGDESSIVNRQSSINWFWLLAALSLALGSWLTQRAQQGEDLRTESRELMARGAAASSLERALQASAADPLSARIKHNLTQTLETNGHGESDIYESMIRLQPTRALNYWHYAEHLTHGTTYDKPDNKRISVLYDRAVALDSNDTEIRMSRGQWKLKNKDQSGWQDIEHIMSLADKPYGKYPATPEMVDLNFARAYAMLAARDLAKNKLAAKNWVARGMQVIAKARRHEEERRRLEEAVHGTPDEERTSELDELEAKLKSLQEKLK